MTLKNIDKIKLFFRNIFIKMAILFKRGYGLSRFPLLHKAFKAVYSLVQGPGYQIKVGEFQMYLDERDTLGLSLGRIHEPHITELAKKYIKEGDTVIDLGANIGYFTLIFSKLVGPKGKVFAFEPDPTNFSILKENILLNKCSNVTIIQKAVSEHNENGAIYLNDENRGDHRIFDSGDGRKKVENIELVSIDQYFKNSDQKINFIKSDIQGAEILALRGMQGLIKNNPSIKILVEFWPSGFRKAKTEPREFFEILEKYNFCFFKNEESNFRLVPIKDEEEFIKNLAGEEDAASVFAIQCTNKPISSKK